MTSGEDAFSVLSVYYAKRGRQYGRRKKEILSGIIHDIDSKKQLIYTSNVRVKYEFSEKYLEKIGFTWKEIDREYILKYMDYFKRIGFINY